MTISDCYPRDRLCARLGFGIVMGQGATSGCVPLTRGRAVRKDINGIAFQYAEC